MRTEVAKSCLATIPKNHMWYIYIVRCADSTLYTGITNNIDLRLKSHNSGKGASYTRSRTPVKLAYKESCRGRPEALRREYQIKSLSRKEKLALISGYKAGIIKASRSKR